MKIVLCLAAVLLLNLLAVPRILAKPIDEYDEEEWSSETTTVASITIVNEWGASNENTTPPSPDQPQHSDPTRLQVVVNPATLEVQFGQTYELTCHVYGANEDTSVYWIQEEPERRYALTEPSEKQVSGSQVFFSARITIDDRSKIGTYTCLAQNANEDSDSALLTMQEVDHQQRPDQEQDRYQPYQQTTPITPDVDYGLEHLRLVVPDMADGDYVEVQCEGAASDDEGSIQWYFGDRLLTDEHPFYPRGKTLYIRPISASQLGNYRCSVPNHRYKDANGVLTFVSKQPTDQPQPELTPSSSITVEEGASRLIQPPGGYYRAYWSRNDGRELPSGMHQVGNDLRITRAHLDHSGTYYCELYHEDGTRKTIPYEIHVQQAHAYQPPADFLPEITIRPQTMNLVEGQRMIIQYSVHSNEPIEIIWTRRTEQGYEPMPSSFIVESNRLILKCATPAVAGVYRITVRNAHGEVHEELRVNVEPRYHSQVREPHYEAKPVRVTVHPNEVNVTPGDKAKMTCYVQGAQQYQVRWVRMGYDSRLPDYIRQEGNSVIITPPADAPIEHVQLQCQVDLTGQYFAHQANAPVNIYDGYRHRRSVRRLPFLTHVKN